MMHCKKQVAVFKYYLMVMANNWIQLVHECTASLGVDLQVPYRSALSM